MRERDDDSDPLKSTNRPDYFSERLSSGLGVMSPVVRPARPDNPAAGVGVPLRGHIEAILEGKALVSLLYGAWDDQIRHSKRPSIVVEVMFLIFFTGQCLQSIL